MRFLLLPLILYPVLELWVLIKVGAAIGVLPTLALIVITALAGMGVLRRVGWQTLARVNLRLNRGEAPTRELFAGARLALGGLLLLLPGFIGDAVGLLLVATSAGHWLREPRQQRPAYTGYVEPGAGQSPDHEPVTIDGEYRRED